jgi:SAM-dependent methyltransferase
MNCLLCQSDKTKHYFTSRNRDFYLCNHCSLIFVNPSHFLTAEEEHNRYIQHKNNPEQGYIDFLNRMVEPSLPYFKNNDLILDFGCGPNDVLAQMIREKGFLCDSFDPFFKPEKLNDSYDFIISTEVFEHLHQPQKTIEFLLNKLTPNGYLGIMTELWSEKENLPQWYYFHDPTHVVFYAEFTFQYLEKTYNLKRVYSDYKRVVIWQKTD